MSSAQPLLDVRDLRVTYTARRHRGKERSAAVDGVTLRLEQGQTLGLVGESGSGKSTIGNAVLGLVEPREGQIFYRGEDITHVSARRRRELGQQIQVIFQDPYGSFNPSRSIGSTLAEPLRACRHLSRRAAYARVGQALEKVGLTEDAGGRYPEQFSGGQRQRIAIARALVLDPRLVICDEPTSALDLSVQAQVLNLLMDLQQQLRLSYLFISHDLAVVRHVAHQVAVLHQGRVVEHGTVDEVINAPAHRYTKTLLAAAPVADPREQARRRGRTVAGA
jgi:ABC-type microcin C transport system duplicated ATPase subunit YejF